MELTKDDIEQLKVILKNAFLKEWKAQGHFESGKVIEEIDYEIKQEVERIEIVGKMYPYGVYIDRGVKANRIPFNPGSGAGRSKYIEGLINFVQRRMSISDLAEAKSVAFAIAHTQKKEGMPTRASHRFTDTGRRVGFISDALDKSRGEIGVFIRQFYRKFVGAEFERIVNENTN